VSRTRLSGLPMQPRLYFDNAATSWPKPESVYRAVEQAMREVGATAGRGTYASATKAGEIVANTRRSVAKLFSAPSPDHVIFTANGTDALNLAIQGLVRQGDRVITTQAEHNSVLRPLYALQKSHGIQLDIVPLDKSGRLNLATVEDALAQPARLLAVNLASNVTGGVVSLSELSLLAKKHRVRLLVDAAQIAGYVPLDLSASPVDLLATPGHKGLLGPLGTGVLMLGRDIADELSPIRFGGTGADSASPSMPDELPTKFEAGNLNVPAIAGLQAGVDWVLQNGWNQLNEERISRSRHFLALIGGTPGLTLYNGTKEPQHEMPVFSFTFDHFSPQEAVVILAEQFGIEARAGLHCAPLMHQALGTFTNGTLRVSLGHFHTLGDIDRLAEALKAIANAGTS
jgi:cysteine desulfurase/selenocysteine lyase